VVTLENIATFTGYIGSLLIIVALSYFAYRIYSTRNMLSKPVVQTSYLLIIAGVATALIAFFPSFLIPLLIVIANAVIYLELILLDKKKYAIFFVPFSTILLGLYYVFSFTSLAGTLLYNLLIIIATSGILIFSLVLLLRRPNFIFFSIFAIIIVNLSLRIAGGIFPAWETLLFIVIYLVTSSFFVGMFVSVFRKSYIGIIGVFLSMSLISAISALIASLLIGRVDYVAYFVTDMFLLIAISLNVAYFLYDYSESMSLSSLLFGVSLIVILGVFLIDIYLTTTTHLIQLLTIRPYLNGMLTLWGMLAALFTAGAAISLLGNKYKTLDVYSIGAPALATWFAIRTTQVVARDELFVIVVSVLVFIIVAIMGYFIIKLIQMGSKRAAFRFLTFLAGILLTGLAVAMSADTSPFIFAGLFTIIGLVFLMASPDFARYLESKLSR
jgi:hypothetical protein